MPPVGFEPTISAGERPKTYALDRAATEIGMLTNGLHVMSLNNCDLRSNYQNLFKGVTTDISVVESDCRSVW